MTEKEYNNLQKGDVIYNMKAKDAYVVDKVEDGYVEWGDGGSTPRTHLLQWNYVSLMRERDDVRSCENIAATEPDAFESALWSDVTEEIHELEPYFCSRSCNGVDRLTNEAYKEVYAALVVLKSLLYPEECK